MPKERAGNASPLFWLFCRRPVLSAWGRELMYSDPFAGAPALGMVWVARRAPVSTTIVGCRLRRRLCNVIWVTINNIIQIVNVMRARRSKSRQSQGA